MNTRNDVHKPSAVNPADYSYVAEQYTGSISGKFNQAQRDRIAAHMAKTGGQISQHEHGGVCHICGSVNAIFTSLFYHAASNTYIVTGHDCADKLDMGGSFERKSFRKAVDDARQYQAGKQKAQALLADRGLSAAWAIYEATDAPTYETGTIRRMVGNLVRYGSFASDKQANYLAILVKKVAAAPAVAAQRQAEHAAALDCPEGRITVTGTVVKVDVTENHWGIRRVMTVKSVDGWLVWGSIPSGFDAERGAIVTFVATVEKSDRDPKFGFFKRPVVK